MPVKAKKSINRRTNGGKPNVANRQPSNNNSNSSSSAYLDSLPTVSLTNRTEILSDMRNVNGSFTNANGSVQNYKLEGNHPIMGRTVILGASSHECGFTQQRS